MGCQMFMCLFILFYFLKYFFVSRTSAAVLCRTWALTWLSSPCWIQHWRTLWTWVKFTHPQTQPVVFVGSFLSYSKFTMPYNAGCSSLFTGWTRQLWETQTSRLSPPSGPNCVFHNWLLTCSTIDFALCLSFCFPGVWDSLPDSAAPDFLFPLQPSSGPSHHSLAAGTHAAHRPGEVGHILTPLQHDIRTIKCICLFT